MAPDLVDIHPQKVFMTAILKARPPLTNRDMQNEVRCYDPNGRNMVTLPNVNVVVAAEEGHKLLACTNEPH